MSYVFFHKHDEAMDEINEWCSLNSDHITCINWTEETYRYVSNSSGNGFEKQTKAADTPPITHTCHAAANAISVEDAAVCTNTVTAETGTRIDDTGKCVHTITAGANTVISNNVCKSTLTCGDDGSCHDLQGMIEIGSAMCQSQTNRKPLEFFTQTTNLQGCVALCQQHDWCMGISTTDSSTTSLQQQACYLVTDVKTYRSLKQDVTRKGKKVTFTADPNNIEYTRMEGDADVQISYLQTGTNATDLGFKCYAKPSYANQQH